MAISDYYFSRTRVPGYGNMFFLKVLQEADDPGGGRSLLGSLVEEEHEGWALFRHSWYPVPRHMTRPSIIRIELENRRQELGIRGDVVLSVDLAGGTERISVERGSAFESSVGSFPGVPANLGIRVDYARLTRAELTLAPGSRIEYIPFDYVARLYRLVDGNDEKILHTGLIGSHNIVDCILLARRFKLMFESEADFDARFWTKLEAFESSPGVDANVTYSKESDRVVAAEVDSEKEYLVALSERTWDDFDPD